MVSYALKTIGTKQKVTLSGSLTEQSQVNLEKMLSELTNQPVEFNCLGIDQINSFGVRVWIEVLIKLAQRTTFDFFECSEIFMSYRNLIPSITGKGIIRSLAVNFQCKNCGSTKTVVLPEEKFSAENKIEPVKCDNCSSMADSNVDPEELFSFLDN